MSLAKSRFSIFVVTLSIFTLTTCTQQHKDDIVKLPDACKVRHGFITVRYANCISRNLRIPLCSGNCFSMDNWKTSRPCSCCKPTKSRCAMVDLKCYDAKRTLVVKRYRMHYAVACSCSPCLDTYKYFKTSGSSV
jgi:hypothetical protein